MLSFHEQENGRQQQEIWTVYALHHALIAPPGIAFEPKRVDGEGIWGLATPLLAEDAEWNRWPGEGVRLFNNRMAHLFQIEIHGDTLLGWIPESTVLELNDESTRLASAPSPEQLLAELHFYAILQERWVLDGDLVARTRAAGPFRAEYLPAQGQGQLIGIIGFPLAGHDDPRALAEKHIVAERLTLSVSTPSGIQDLVWVFD